MVVQGKRLVLGGRCVEVDAQRGEQGIVVAVEVDRGGVRLIGKGVDGRVGVQLM